jgi:hypothetical protein
MDKTKSHWNVTPQPPMRRSGLAPPKSMNWKCVGCSMHYAFGRRVAMPAECGRCGGNKFKAYWSIR